MKFLNNVIDVTVTSSLIKADSSGKHVAAVSNTDYLPVASPVSTGTCQTGNLRVNGNPNFFGIINGNTVPLIINGITGAITPGTAGVDFLAPSSITNMVVTTGSYANPAWVTSIASSKLTGTVPTANLGSGTASSATVLCGNQTWVVNTIAGEPVCGRLTLTTGVAVTTSDVTSSGTIYFTPYNGNSIPLYNTSTSLWEIQNFTEQSISLTGLGGTATNYDIFASNNNNGTFTITATAWTNVTTRATALTLQDGVWVLTGSLGKRYLGTAFVATGVTVDSIAGRWLWNKYNRLPRKLESGDTSNGSYTLTGGGSGTWQYCRNSSSTSQCSFVIGQVTEPIWISTSNYGVIPTGAVYVGTGVNISFNSSTTTATISNGFRIGGQTGSIQSGGFINTNYLASGPGLILLTQLEYAENGTITFFPGATTSGATERSAITAIVWG